MISWPKVPKLFFITSGNIGAMKCELFTVCRPLNGLSMLYFNDNINVWIVATVKNYQISWP